MGKKIKNNPCPQCGCVDFEEIGVFAKAGGQYKDKEGNTRKRSAGRYKVKCNDCGHEETVVTRSPTQYNQY